MAVRCTNCGGAHPSWDCSKPTKSTAARKNARVMADCVCEVCSKGFEAVPHEVKRGKARTCSKACAAKLAARPDQSGENNPNWKGGVPSSEIKRTYKDRHPEKAAAHAALTGAIRRGELVRQPCEVCSEPKTEGHHDDYTRPLEVRWLCKRHHLEAHSGRFGAQALTVDTLPKPCTCHPDDNPPVPCARKYAYSDCVAASQKPRIGRPRTGFNKKEYNRQFTADLRTIKRLGLNCTVREWREKNEKQSS